MLCVSCERINLPLVVLGQSSKGTQLFSSARGSRRAGSLIDQLSASAKTCSLCNLILETLQTTVRTKGMNFDTMHLFTWASPEEGDPVGISRIFLRLGKEVGKFIDVFTEENSPAAKLGFAVGKDLEQDPASNSSFMQYRKWLSDCVEHHVSCPGDPLVALPRRLLEVSAEDGTECLRVTRSEGLHGQYTALSHCWGTFGGLETKKTTLRDHIRGIKIADLSKTVRDAVCITRGLKIRYLWVDTLCIIQDDVDDWKQESSRMDSIYHLAHVTIAASGAVNGNQGCFYERDTGLSPVTVPITFPPSKELTSITFKMHSGSVSGGFTHSPLNGRGWCLQESFLSRRIIHFRRDRVVWQCKECLTSEDYKVLRQSRRSSQTNRATQTQLQLFQDPSTMSWFSLIEEYARRNLTHPADKLYGIAGLASFFKTSSKGNYYAGLWQGRFHKGLLWMSLSGQMIRPMEERAPSWSWAALDGAINHLHNYEAENSMTYPIAEIVRFGPPESILEPARLLYEEYNDDPMSLRVPLKWIKRLDHTLVASEFANFSSEALKDLLYDHHDLQCHALFTTGDDHLGWVAFDQESFSEESFTCIPVNVVKKGKTFQAYNVMVLGFVDGSEDHYRRLGVGEITRDGWFGDTMKRLVFII